MIFFIVRIFTNCFKRCWYFPIINILYRIKIIIDYIDITSSSYFKLPLKINTFFDHCTAFGVFSKWAGTTLNHSAKIPVPTFTFGAFS